jgi:hypothetical protein
VIAVLPSNPWRAASAAAWWRLPTRMRFRNTLTGKQVASAPRQSPPVAHSPREACSGVMRLRGRAQPWGRPRARRQRRA